MVPQACGPYSNWFISITIQRSCLMEKVPKHTCECMWILTWTCDRTRGSRLNNFYKKGKGKKRKTFCVLIIHKRQTLMRQSTVMQHIHRWSFYLKASLTMETTEQNPISEAYTTPHHCLWYIFHSEPTCRSPFHILI